MTDVALRFPTSTTAVALQDSLVELIDLSLQAKQAHWNVTGPAFKPLHEFLDEMTTEYRGWYDDVAERLVAIGVQPDGRTTTVAAHTPLGQLPEGALRDAELIPLFLDRVETVAGRIRERLAPVGEVDLVTQDLLIGIVHGLDKQAWMLRAQKA
jgi:starvation-inducible DNA-binding protein